MLIRFLLPLIILAAAVAGYLYLEQTKTVKPPVEPTEKAWQVGGMPVKIEALSPQLNLYGRVETPQYATLTAALTADVVTVSVLEGILVAAGDVLIQLDDRDSKLLISQRDAELAELKAKIQSEYKRHTRDKQLLNSEQELLRYTQASVTRMQTLVDKGLTTRVNLDTALADQARQHVSLQRLKYDISEHGPRLAQIKAQQSRAQALLEQANVDDSRTRITAPFAGRISKLNVAMGDRVRGGDPLLSLYALDQLEVRAQIPQRHLATVQTALAQGESLLATATVSGQEYAFKLARLSGEMQIDKGGLDALFRLQGDNATLTLGAFVDLQLQLPELDDLVLAPFSTLYGLNQVYRIIDGRLQSIDVIRVGERESNVLLRSSELVAGDILLVTQLPNAITGLRVEAIIE